MYQGPPTATSLQPYTLVDLRYSSPPWQAYDDRWRINIRATSSKPSTIEPSKWCDGNFYLCHAIPTLYWLQVDSTDSSTLPLSFALFSGQTVLAGLSTAMKKSRSICHLPRSFWLSACEKGVRPCYSDGLEYNCRSLKGLRLPLLWFLPHHSQSSLLFLYGLMWENWASNYLLA